MNNYQDNNTNPQTDNNQFNQQKFIVNENQPLNVIPSTTINSQDNLSSPVNENYFNIEPQKNIEQNQFVNTNIINNNQDNYFANNTVNFNQNYQQANAQNKDINQIIGGESNKFINNNIDTSSTSLNNLNVEGEYNNMPKVDYSKDPKVMENIQKNKKNTITITGEGKVFIIIIVVLLLFIFVLPTIFDLITKISYS